MLFDTRKQIKHHHQVVIPRVSRGIDSPTSTRAGACSHSARKSRNLIEQIKFEVEKMSFRA